MRMNHYYAVAAGLLVPALLATLVTGMGHDGSDKHLSVGLFTAVLCVATSTLFILFMIITGRVLKAARGSRPLGPEFLEELNHFFARRGTYPAALGGAALATVTAVLGYGQNIGVHQGFHLALGLATVLYHLMLLPACYRMLVTNRELLDRAAGELDRIDRETGSEPPDPEPAWTVGPVTRWIVFAVAAWSPYAYWGLVEWRGRFDRVPPLLVYLCAGVSLIGLVKAWGARRRTGPRS